VCAEHFITYTNAYSRLHALLSLPPFCVQIVRMQQLHHGMALELRVVQQFDPYVNAHSSSSNNSSSSSGTSSSNTAALPQPTALTITVYMHTKSGTHTGTVHREQERIMDLIDLNIACKNVLEISENFSVDFLVRDAGTGGWTEISHMFKSLK
jgi:hypothetical protein